MFWRRRLTGHKNVRIVAKALEPFRIICHRRYERDIRWLYKDATTVIHDDQ